MNKKIPSSTRKLIAVGTILLLLLFATSTMNYSYAVNKNTLQNGTFPSPAPLPIKPPGLLGTLIVTTKVSGGNKNPSDFTTTVKGTSPSPAPFAGSSSGTTVTLKPGRYRVLG